MPQKLVLEMCLNLKLYFYVFDTLRSDNDALKNVCLNLQVKTRGKSKKGGEKPETKSRSNQNRKKKEANELRFFKNIFIKI